MSLLTSVRLLLQQLVESMTPKVRDESVIGVIDHLVLYGFVP